MKRGSKKRAIGELGADSKALDNELQSSLPPTTRWNRPATNLYSRLSKDKNLVDPRPNVKSGTTAESEEREYRQWRSRVVRTKETRSASRQGFTFSTFLSASTGLEERCFLCKLSFRIDPNHRKSFPVQEWMQSAGRGCPHCQHITLGVKVVADTFGIAIELLHIATIAFRPPSYVAETPDASDTVEQIDLAIFWVDAACGDCAEDVQIQRKRRPTDQLEITALDDKVAPPVPEEYQLKCFQQARDLLARCDKEHSCQRSSGSPSTRLLDLHGLSKGSSVKVVRSESIESKSEVRYAALSYCWGNLLPLRLLRRGNPSLEQMETEITWEQLPKLFQDAIMFTSSLGLSYLWIDAICIIQDDREDWEREAAKMGAIYYHSHVTIGATSSKDSTIPLTVSPFRNVRLELEAEFENYEYVEARTMGGDLTWPLHHRGWAYQEILLPSRYLDFDSNELSLHCCEGTTHASEGTIVSNPSDKHERQWADHTKELDFRQPWSFRCFWAQILNGGGKDVGSKGIELWQAWQEVVMMYTNRRLTFASDRLPAIGGLAAEFLRCSEPGEEYYAGMWKTAFVEHLGWKTYFTDVLPINEYQAPSWSWASVSDIIDYGVGNSRSEDRTEPFTTVKEISVTTASSNPFGHVTGGFARLEGPYAWCTMEHSSPASSQSSRHFTLESNAFYRSAEFVSDSELELSEVSENADETLISARRKTTGSKSSIMSTSRSYKVAVLQLWSTIGWARTNLVLGVVDIERGEYIFQRLGVVMTHNRLNSEDVVVDEFKIV